MSRQIACAALLLGLLLPLAGCVTPEQLRQEDEAACLSYGFHQGTPDFAACLQRESLARRYAATPWWGAPPYGWEGPGWHPFP
jgi:hypothetical protein